MSKIIKLNNNIVTYVSGKTAKETFDLNNEENVKSFIRKFSSYQFSEIVNFFVKEEIKRSKDNLTELNNIAILLNSRNVNINPLSNKIIEQINEINDIDLLKQINNCLSIEGFSLAYESSLNKYIEEETKKSDKKRLEMINEKEKILKNFQKGVTDSLESKPNVDPISAVNGITKDDLNYYSAFNGSKYDVNVDVLNADKRDAKKRNVDLNKFKLLASYFNINLTSLTNKTIDKTYILFASPQRLKVLDPKFKPSSKKTNFLKDNVYKYSLDILNNLIDDEDVVRSLRDWFSDESVSKLPFSYKEGRNSGEYIKVLTSELIKIGNEIGNLSEVFEEAEVIDSIINKKEESKSLMKDQDKYDWWQKLIIEYIEKRRSVLVEGPTSGGKTFASINALFQIISMKGKDEKIVYIAPTHQLAVQVHANITLTFNGEKGMPEAKVAILTDSICYIPNDWSIVVGTPHRLNVFLSEFGEKTNTSVSSIESSFEECVFKKRDINYMIFDECHILSTTYDSTEEGKMRSLASRSILSCCNKDTIFIGLSATINDINSLLDEISNRTSIDKDNFSVVTYTRQDVGYKSKPTDKEKKSENFEVKLPPQITYYMSKSGIMELKDYDVDDKDTYPYLSKELSIGFVYSYIRKIYQDFKEMLPCAIFPGDDAHSLKLYISLIKFMKDKANDECPRWFETHGSSLVIINSYYESLRDIEDDMSIYEGKSDKNSVSRFAALETDKFKLEEKAEKSLTQLFSKNFKNSLENNNKASKINLFNFMDEKKALNVLNLVCEFVGIPFDTFKTKYIKVEDEESEDEESEDEESEDEESEDEESEDEEETSCMLSEETISFILNFANRKDKWLSEGICYGMPSSIVFKSPSSDSDFLSKDNPEWISLMKKQNITQGDYVQTIIDGTNMGIGIITPLIPYGIQCEITKYLSKSKGRIEGPSFVICGPEMSMGINYPLGSTAVIRINSSKVGKSQFTQIKGRSGRRGTGVKFTSTFLLNITNTTSLDGNEDPPEYNEKGKGLFYDENLIHEMRNIYSYYMNNKSEIGGYYDQIVSLNNLNIDALIDMFKDMFSISLEDSSFDSNVQNFRMLKNKFSELQGRSRFSSKFNDIIYVNDVKTSMNVYSILFYIAQAIEMNFL